MDRRDIKKTQGTYEFDPSTQTHKYYVKAPPVVNLVISGGGAKGVILPGAVRAFENYHPNGSANPSFMEQLQCIAGSSIGAVTAGLLASGITANNLISSVNSAGGKALLGKGFIGLLHHDGEPLLNFVRENMWVSIKNRLCEIYKTNDPATACRKFLSDTISTQADLELMQPLINYLEKGEQGKISFKLLDKLHALAPQFFKKLIVTGTMLGTEDNTGKTIYFNSENTPNLDIPTACRASAALPIVLKPAVIPISELKGGAFENDPDFPKAATAITFVDGGYLDNIPVSAATKSAADQSPLETIALVFDEAEEVLGQSPMFNVRNPGPVFTPSTLDKVARDYLPRKLEGIKIQGTNTASKSNTFENIRENYTQRHIPFKMDIKTTHFDSAEKNAVQYQQQGEEVTKEFLLNHDDELICYHEANSLQELQSIISRSSPQYLDDFNQNAHLPSTLAATTTAATSTSNTTSTSSSSSSSSTSSTTTMMQNTLQQATVSDQIALQTLQKYNEHIVAYVNHGNHGGTILDPSDPLNRTYGAVLKQDFDDNLQNNLNNNQKQLNILKILLAHYYHSAKNNEAYTKALHTIITKEFPKEIKQLQLDINTDKPIESLRNSHKILNAMYPNAIDAKPLFDTFIHSIKTVIEDRTFWEGKAVSKIGRSNKVPTTIQKIDNILSMKVSNEDKYYLIQLVIESNKQKNQANRSPEIIALDHAILNCTNLAAFHANNYLDRFINTYLTLKTNSSHSTTLTSFTLTSTSDHTNKKTDEDKKDKYIEPPAKKM